MSVGLDISTEIYFRVVKTCAVPYLEIERHVTEIALVESILCQIFRSWKILFLKQPYCLVGYILVKLYLFSLVLLTVLFLLIQFLE